MRSTLLLVSALSLGACDQPENVKQIDYQRLVDRVSTLEGRVAELSAEQTQLASAPVTQVRPTEPQMSYQLVGTSFKEEGVFRYLTLSDCEEARQALLDSWRDDDERNRAKGVVFTSRPTPSCLPL